jgi:putative ABC transport system permease protein
LSREFVPLVAMAILIATPFTIALMSKWLESFAYRIELSWLPFLGASLLVCLVAVATVASQAFRTAHVNPVDCLRTE